MDTVIPVLSYGESFLVVLISEWRSEANDTRTELRLPQSVIELILERVFKLRCYGNSLYCRDLPAVLYLHTRNYICMASIVIYTKPIM